jgi:hypothetical protein
LTSLLYSNGKQDKTDIFIGKSGPVKLKKPGPATEKSEKAKTTEKKVTKAKSTTKAAPAKKAAATTTTTTTKKSPMTTKKTTTKTKANASKPRKTAPAVSASLVNHITHHQIYN